MWVLLCEVYYLFLLLLLPISHHLHSLRQTLVVLWLPGLEHAVCHCWDSQTPVLPILSAISDLLSMPFKALCVPVFLFRSQYSVHLPTCVHSSHWVHTAAWFWNVHPSGAVTCALPHEYAIEIKSTGTSACPCLVYNIVIITECGKIVHNKWTTDERIMEWR